MADVMFRPFTYDTKVGVFIIIAKHCVIGIKYSVDGTTLP